MSQNINYGGDQINIGSTNNVIYQSPNWNPVEAALLDNVKQEVDSRLAFSLRKAELINLGKQLQPEQVENPYRVKVKIPGKLTASLASITNILKVFEYPEISGKLLILGEPGAGKTTVMLELAQALIDKARKDTKEPIPVLFDLSSWKGQNQKYLARSIFTWLVKELHSKYDLDENIGKDLLKRKRLLPMLDGLDEVKPEFQAACVEAINQWLNQVNKAVVCSRWEEYEKVVRGQWEEKSGEKLTSKQETRLQLHGAILLQALTLEQIQTYLNVIEQSELWNYLQRDKELLKLMQVPLLLSMAVLSYSDISLQEWQQLNSTKERINLLLEAYIEGMLGRPLESKAYQRHNSPSDEQTRYWLKFLAQHLSQTEFLIEDMQPSWLQSTHQREAYRLLYGALGGIFIGKAETIQPVEKLSWSFLKDRSTLFHWMLKGLLFGLPVGLLGGIIYYQNSLKGWLIGLSVGSIYGLVQETPKLLSHGLMNLKIPAKVGPNQGIWKSIENALFTAIFIAVLSQLAFFLLYGLRLLSSDFVAVTNNLTDQLIHGLLIGLISGLIAGIALGGGQAAIQHFALRFILYRYGHIPWNYAQFLDYCTERSLLQRVGGRYRFMHELLREHFSKMAIEVQSSRFN